VSSRGTAAVGHGSRAYVRGTDRKLRVVDVGDSHSPLIVGTIETPALRRTSISPMDNSSFPMAVPG
jgi:hypothetical protein